MNAVEWRPLTTPGTALFSLTVRTLLTIWPLQFDLGLKLDSSASLGVFVFGSLHQKVSSDSTATKRGTHKQILTCKMKIA